MSLSRVTWLCAAVLLLASARLAAQEGEIERYVELAGAGRLDEVRRALPGLLASRPEDPGVMYLKALTLADGSEAVRIYQDIVENHPRSPWADDALYRIAQFYQALGLVRTADLKMAQLRREYPDSPFGGGAGPVLAARSRDTAAAPARAPVSGGRPAGATRPATGRPFALQVGAFSSEENAAKIKSRFAGAGYPVEIIRRSRGSRTMYLVWVGRYSSEEEARAQIPRIRQQQNVSPMVVSR